MRGNSYGDSVKTNGDDPNIVVREDRFMDDRGH
jgi:hypothetical protein